MTWATGVDGIRISAQQFEEALSQAHLLRDLGAPLNMTAVREAALQEMVKLQAGKILLRIALDRSKRGGLPAVQEIINLPSLAEVLRDPFHPEGRRLRIEINGLTVAVTSVGPDGVLDSNDTEQQTGVAGGKSDDIVVSVKLPQLSLEAAP